jgi:hypothetical protein
MIKEICKDKEERNLSCRKLRGRIRALSATTCRMLKKNKFRNVKESTKPRLTEDIKKDRLAFCKAHEH